MAAISAARTLPASWLPAARGSVGGGGGRSSGGSAAAAAAAAERRLQSTWASRSAPTIDRRCETAASPGRRDTPHRHMSGEPPRRRAHLPTLPMAMKVPRISSGKSLLEAPAAAPVAAAASVTAWLNGRGRWRRRRATKIAAVEGDYGSVVSENKSRGLPGPNDLVEAMEALFAAYDTDSNGAVDIDEFVSAKRIENLAVGKPADDSVAVAEFLRADAHLDAVVRFADFKKLLIMDFMRKGLSVAQMIEHCRQRAEAVSEGKGMTPSRDSWGGGGSCRGGGSSTPSETSGNTPEGLWQEKRPRASTEGGRSCLGGGSSTPSESSGNTPEGPWQEKRPRASSEGSHATTILAASDRLHQLEQRPVSSLQHQGQQQQEQQRPWSERQSRRMFFFPAASAGALARDGEQDPDPLCAA